MSTRQPPPYFFGVRERARRRWSQLESDPELAGPWKQLFDQVQSPRHVLSELLQNADDAGARRVWVSISDNRFVFEHDGKDFDEEDFVSLCRFGFSNKRKLHTIGFRGVGFKATFSLGEAVEVLTPSLAVRFHKHRFTEPAWIEDAPSCDVTRIAVEIQDPNREKALRKNFQDWVGSPASLLFFSCVNELTVGDITLCKQRIGPGPVMGSERIRLIGRDQHDVIVFNSMEDLFPQEAVDEIRQERNVEDLCLPPCRVQLVVGLPGEQRLYVVLPTGVTIDVPFSCNAPFLQDPARSAIKNPSLSPTNRWLLHRLGRLAGEAMLKWLGNRAQEVEDRAQAYQLLPEKPDEEDSLESDATLAICRAFTETVGDEPVLLTTGGRLVDSDDCVSPPNLAYSIWTPSQLLKVFGDGQEHVLSGAVTEEQRRRLQSWGWLDGLDEEDLIDHLASGQRIPRPEHNENILTLWGLVQQSVRYDYSGQRRRRLAIVPAENCNGLLPAERIVRLPSKKEAISEEAWGFLTRLVQVVDQNWLRFLESLKDQKGKWTQSALQLLKDIDLDRSSETNAIVANACRNLFCRRNVPLEQHIWIAHLMAALDAKTPEEFRCITRDGEQHRISDGIIGSQDPSIEALLPEDWAAAHFLHDKYFEEYTACSRQQWEDWLKSQKSGFLPFIHLRKTIVFDSYDLREEVRRFVKSRGSNESIDFYAQVQRVKISDFGFPEELKEFWSKRSKEDPTIWAKIAERILTAPPWYWKACTEARLEESNYTHTRRFSQPVVAEWITTLSSTRCLFDTEGQIRAPAELYLRTPETEPLMGVEPFVCAELDTEATKPLLRLLGVRDTPAGLDKLLERIRSLTRAPDPSPLLLEIIKWYDALDKALARCNADDLDTARKAFASEPLILTSAGEWVKSSEVFQYAGGGDFPDAPVVHPAANGLGMWSRLGVADRPTVDLVLDWLKGLASGEAVRPRTIQRVEAVLQRYPVEVWETCRHWLSLDNVWTPTEQLRFRLTMHSLPRSSDLFPTVKAATAKLQMLPAEVCERPPFASLPDLGTVVEHRLTRRPGALAGAIQKPWLAALSRALMRVKLADEAETERVRYAAARLSRSVWQPFDDRDSLQVTPFVEGTPAGQPHSPEVLWYEETIFVRGGRPGKSFDALVAELARPFANRDVTEAIKACIERDEDFILEYMQEHFTMETETILEKVEGKVGAEEERVTGLEGKGRILIATDEEPLMELSKSEQEREVHTDDSRKHCSKQHLKIFARYARACGYHWDADRRRFVHPDGSWIERCGPPFRWKRLDAAGKLVARFWDSPQRLTQGVEVPAELWELLRGNPMECCLVLLDTDGRIRELPGPELVRMVEEKVLTLYPSKYRIREESSR